MRSGVSAQTPATDPPWKPSPHMVGSGQLGTTSYGPVRSSPPFSPGAAAEPGITSAAPAAAVVDCTSLVPDAHAAAETSSTTASAHRVAAIRTLLRCEKQSRGV